MASEERGGLLVLTMAGAGGGAVAGVGHSGWSSFGARGTTAHREPGLWL